MRNSFFTKGHKGGHLLSQSLPDSREHAPPYEHATKLSDHDDIHEVLKLRT